MRREKKKKKIKWKISASCPSAYLRSCLFISAATPGRFIWSAGVRSKTAQRARSFYSVSRCARDAGERILVAATCVEGADGESIVMDQRASRPQPWLSECREQRQLFTPPSLFINALPPPPHRPPHPTPRSAVHLFFCFISRIPHSLCLRLCAVAFWDREKETRVTWPFLPWCLLASVSGWLGNLWNVAIDDQAVKQFD